MGAQSTVMAYQTMQSINTDTFTGSYLAIGSEFPLPSRIFKIVNDSNVPVFISTNGTTDMDFIPPATFVLYDICTNKSKAVPSIELPPTQFFAKGVAGSGSVYVVSLFAFTPSESIPS